MSSYTGLDMFVHDAKQNFWTWIQFPPSPPYILRNRFLVMKSRFSYLQQLRKLNQCLFKDNILGS